MAETNAANLDSVLGRLVVEQGLASDKDVQDCIALQKDLAHSSEGKPPPLVDLLINNGIVTKKQLERLRPAAEEQRPQTTQQIPGFQILDRLGAGAMATVFKARQISLDRMVAIKVLPKKHTNNAEFVERFYAEGRAAAKLNHANIVGALDVGRAGEYHYFVMEYVEGKTLHDEMMVRKRYEEKEALRVMIDIAKALEHAHKAGFIHRDVKPKNIMLTKDGVAKLADMGLARAVSDREAAEAEAGKAYGTPYYISPEQIRGEVNIDFRADIYSYGATFYHVLTGVVPFDGPNPSAVMFKHLKQAPIPVDHHNPKLSAGIAEVIEVCMAKDPNKRYRSTGDLLQDLECVARGEPPLQARSKVDMASLATIESASGPVPDLAGETQMVPTLQGGFVQVGPGGIQALMTQPLFWLAVGGWGLSLLLLIVLVLKSI